MDDETVAAIPAGPGENRRWVKLAWGFIRNQWLTFIVAVVVAAIMTGVAWHFMHPLQTPEPPPTPPVLTPASNHQAEDSHPAVIAGDATRESPPMHTPEPPPTPPVLTPTGSHQAEDGHATVTAGGEPHESPSASGPTEYLSATFDPSGKGGPAAEQLNEFAAKLSQLKYDKDEVISARAVRIDGAALLALWESPKSEAAPKRNLMLFDKLMGLEQTSSFGKGDALVKGFLFKSVDSDQWVNLSVNVSSRSVGGYALMHKSVYDIRTLPNNGSDQIPTQMLVEMREPKSAQHKYDFAPTGNPNPATSGNANGASQTAAQRNGTSAWTAECQDRKPVDVQTPLRLVFAFTNAAAENAARADTDGGHNAIATYVVGTKNMLREALKRAGVLVTVEANPEEAMRVAYVEPDQEHTRKPEDVLREEIDALTSNPDPNLVDFVQWRKQIKADIGVLIVHNPTPGACGVAAQPMDAKNAFVVVHWKCVGGNLDVEHEIGHILGLDHQDGKRASPPYARAFMHVDKADAGPFMTIMGDAAAGCYVRDHDCVRVAMFSNPGDSYTPEKGARPTIVGLDGKIDAACRLRKTVPAAVTFKDQL